MIHKLVTGVELQSSKTDPLSILKELSRISLIKYGVFDVDEKGKFIRYSKCLGKIINILNIPIGQRVYTNPHIPRYLFSASKDIIAKFFERVFINEARILKTRIVIGHSIDITDSLPDNLKEIVLSSEKTCKNKGVKRFVESNLVKIPNLIKDYKNLLLRLDCSSSKPYISKVYKTKYDKIRISWAIFITGKDLDVIKENCDLNNSIKWRQLKLRDNFTTRYQRNDRLNQILEVAKRLGIFKRKELMEELNLGQVCVSYYLREAVNKGLLKKCEKGRNIYYKINRPRSLFPRLRFQECEHA